MTEPIDCFTSKAARLGNEEVSWRRRRTFGQRGVMP
jgi:hypothetical protein